MKPHELSGLILSAGASSRMGYPKALLKVGGRTLLEVQVELLQLAGVAHTFVVVGCEAENIIGAHASLEATFVTNANWENGKFSSLVTGLEKIAHGDVILLPIDTVGVTADTAERIISEGLQKKTNIVPTYENKGGHPVFLTEAFASHLKKCPAGSRLDELLHQCERTERYEVEDRNILNNINTEDEWRAYLLSTTADRTS